MEKCSNFGEIIVFSNKAALQLIKLKDYEPAKQYLDHCLHLINSKSIKNSAKLLGITFNSYGCLFKRQGHLKKSLKCFNKAIELSINSDLSLSEIYLNISNIYSQISDHQSALSNAIKALESLTFKSKSSVTAVHVYKAIATEYQHLKLYEKASKILTSALNLSQKLMGRSHLTTKTIEKMRNEILAKKSTRSRSPIFSLETNKLAKPFSNNRTPEPRSNNEITDFIPAPFNFEELVKKNFFHSINQSRSITPTGNTSKGNASKAFWTPRPAERCYKFSRSKSSRFQAKTAISNRSLHLQKKFPSHKSDEKLHKL